MTKINRLGEPIDEPEFTELSRNPDLARLDETYLFDSGIKGYTALHEDKCCMLSTGGVIDAYPGLKWDFASGSIAGIDITYDGRPMRTASLVHDIGCWLTDEGLVPWNLRKKFDALFRKILYQCMCAEADELPRGRRELRKAYARWRSFRCWVAVRAYSRRVRRKDDE